MGNNDYYIFEEREEAFHKPQDVIDREWSLLAENLQIIIDNSQQIIQNEKYFYTQFSLAMIGTTIHGSQLIPLGILLLLWKDGHLKDTCPHCGGTVYIIGAGGSALSGSHKWYGCCVKCRERITGSSIFSQIWEPAYELKNKYLNRRTIKRYKLKSDNWFQKLQEKRRPDEILKDRIEGSTVDELIDYLKSHTKGIINDKNQF